MGVSGERLTKLIGEAGLSKSLCSTPSLASPQTGFLQTEVKRMYNPGRFEETDLAVLWALVAAHPLAAVVVGTQFTEGGGLSADHLPLLCESAQDGSQTLIGHAARANPICVNAENESPCLAIFQGVGHYISPRWYASKEDDPRVVPTWNYQVVHVEGTLRAIHDKDRKREIVTLLTERFEGSERNAWRVSDAPAEAIDRLLDAIVGIEIQVTRVIGKSKLSQNQPARNQASVVESLGRIGTPDASAMADAVSKACKLDKPHQ